MFGRNHDRALEIEVTARAFGENDAARRLLHKRDLVIAKGDGVRVVEPRLVGDTITVDQRAISALQVMDGEGVSLVADLGVVAR